MPSAAIRELRKRWCKSASSTSWCPFVSKGDAWQVYLDFWETNPEWTTFALGSFGSQKCSSGGTLNHLLTWSVHVASDTSCHTSLVSHWPFCEFRWMNILLAKHNTLIRICLSCFTFEYELSHESFSFPCTHVNSLSRFNGIIETNTCMPPSWPTGFLYLVYPPKHENPLTGHALVYTGFAPRRLHIIELSHLLIWFTWPKNCKGMPLRMEA